MSISNIKFSICWICIFTTGTRTLDVRVTFNVDVPCAVVLTSWVSSGALVHFLSLFCLDFCIRSAAICFLVTVFGWPSIIREGRDPIAAELLLFQYNMVPTRRQLVAKPRPQNVNASENWMCLLPAKHSVSPMSEYYVRTPHLPFQLPSPEEAGFPDS